VSYGGYIGFGFEIERRNRCNQWHSWEKDWHHMYKVKESHGSWLDGINKEKWNEKMVGWIRNPKLWVEYSWAIANYRWWQ